MKKTIITAIIIISIMIFSWHITGAQDKIIETRMNGSQRLDSNISIDIGHGVKIDMVKISKGSFIMGSDQYSWAKHTVNITQDFYIGKTEVTVAQWNNILYVDPSNFKSGANYPVEQVSWADCNKFIDRLNAINQVYGVFRMPTEAEWEYACRAGTTTDYYFGSSSVNIGNYCWYFDNSGKTTHPVGQKSPNAWGLYDMGGNVWEWCSDWWVGSYLPDAATDPVGLNTGIAKVFRGGAWNTYNTVRQNGGYYNGAGCCRSADRGGGDPNYSYNFVGLRLALTPVGQ